MNFIQLNSLSWQKNTLKNNTVGLLWWCSGWESACQCRGHGFEPWSGRIPHAAEQLGPWATTTEPARLEPVLRSGRGRDSERPAHRDEEWPPLAATGESPRTETKTQHSQKFKKIKNNTVKKKQTNVRNTYTNKSILQRIESKIEEERQRTYVRRLGSIKLVV